LIGGALRRLRLAGGYTLIELLAVCLLLSIVLTGVISIMVGGSHAELNLNRRFQAQASARTALTVFRGDAHIACAASAPTTTSLNFYIPQTDRTTNPATAPQPTTQCGTTSNNMAKVVWCTQQSPSNSTKWALYRSTSGTCSTTSKFQADWLTTNTPFTVPATFPNGQLRTVSIDIPVSLKSANAGAAYDLNETIALRNTVWNGAANLSCAPATPCVFGLCTLVGGCYPPNAP
jgi:type II secretory pathway pseudopilin PulG